VKPPGRRLCDAGGRVVVEDLEAPHAPHRFFDPRGRLVEEWWWSPGESRRSHTSVQRAPGCAVESSDFDGDTLVDKVCRAVEGPPARHECGPFERPIAGGPCEAACARGFTRCGCDARGRVVEQIADPSHQRQTFAHDDAGRVVERGVFLAEREVGRETTEYDAQGREFRKTSRDGQVTVSEHAWKDDGSEVATVTVDGVLGARTVTDLSVPGQRRVERSDATGLHETWLTRERGAQKVTVVFEPPLDESSLACARDADCAAWVDRCDCGRAFHVNRRALPRLQQARRKRCVDPSPCPAAVSPVRAPGARCVLSLCAPVAP
jgi:hypothetical protein